MLNTREFGFLLKNKGFSFYSGVPCSFLKPLINYAINECDYVMAANEGDAVAICAGVHLSGKKSIFLCQNSGLTNAASPLTSLNYTFKIPLLGFVSLRGESGLSDAPQHELMGQITTDMLDVMKIKWEVLADNYNTAAEQVDKANTLIESGDSFFFIVKKKTFEPESLGSQALGTQVDVSRLDAIETLNTLRDDKTIFFATTGFTGRELYEAGNFDSDFYMVGSMGCVSSIALGTALAKPEKDVVILDGDGALLMRMGALATNAYCNPTNMLHILFDNNVHLSTGGQKTVASNVDFVSLASASGYKNSFRIESLKQLEDTIISWKKNKGLTFLSVRVNNTIKENLGRPDLPPYKIKDRLMKFLGKL